jgi:hypothetical protein
VDKPAGQAFPVKALLLGCGGLALLGLIGVAGVGYWFFSRPSASPGSTPKTETSSSGWTVRADEDSVVGDADAARITFPKGAVERDVRIAITPQPAETRSAPGARVVGKIWNFQVDGQDRYNFKKPVRLSLPFDRALVKDGADVGLSRWDKTRWRKMPRARVNGDRIEADIEHFSEYAPTQEEALPLPKSGNPWLDVECWYGQVQISYQDVWGHKNEVSSSHWSLSQDALVDFRTAPRIGFPGLTKVTWTTPAKNAPGERPSLKYSVNDAGYKTDDDVDRNGNVFYHQTNTLARAPEDLSVTVEVDAKAGTYSLSGSAARSGIVTVKHWSVNLPKGDWQKTEEEKVSASFRTGARKLPENFGTISETFALPSKEASGDIGTGLSEDIRTVKGTMTVTLSPAPFTLVARIRGPRVVRRGDAVTLDASWSKGDITDYRWKFSVAAGCPARPADPREISGKTVTFTALWDFEARLEVTDKDGKQDSTRHSVTVKPRTGADWETFFKSIPDTPVPWPLFAGTKAIETTNYPTPQEQARLLDLAKGNTKFEQLEIGVNHCKYHAPEIVTGHWIHRTEPVLRTWKDVGYDIVLVRDEGPFNGLYFIKTQKLAIDRRERINKSLLPGGEAYKMNGPRGTFEALTALLNQVKAHEKVHGELAKEELLRLRNAKQDPAAQIEKVIGASAEDVTTEADKRIWDAESLIVTAAEEPKVKDRLSTKDAFKQAATVWLPVDLIDPKTGKHIEVQRTFDPLWAIGDERK